MKTYPPVATFISLRRWIGYVGISLPWLVALFAFQFQPSISDYYYTDSGNWFVGSLFTIGAFFCSYFGYDKWDRRMSIIAGLCAFCVALYPTDRGTSPTTIVGVFHYIFAASLFGLLAWFSGYQFTQSSNLELNRKGSLHTGNKGKRNVIYKACACVICAMLVLILLGKLTGLSEKFTSWHPVFWLETIALEAFGFSWMLKGQFILRDETPGDEERVRLIGIPLKRSLLPRF